MSLRPIWRGTISFGLVNIPVALHPATRTTGQLKFRLLRREDQSPIKYKRVAEADEREVLWDQIIKGYEFEKGRFVELTEEDFKRVRVPSNRTVDIREFVRLDEIDPMFFDEPYYLVPEKNGAEAYTLLREGLGRQNMAGVAKVVIKTREHLAVVKPVGRALVLELMHFADELLDPAELSFPADRQVGEPELGMAESLIRDLSGPWEPEKYRDEYHQGLLQLIEQKVGRKAALPAKPKPKAATKVVDLVAVLQESLERAQAAKKKPARKEQAA